MATKSNDGGSSGELPDRTGATGGSSKNLHIQMLQRGGDELASDMNPFLNLFLVCILC